MIGWLLSSFPAAHLDSLRKATAARACRLGVGAGGRNDRRWMTTIALAEDTASTATATDKERYARRVWLQSF
jgi:hypothetical protein